MIEILVKTQLIFNRDCEHVRLEMNDFSGIIVNLLSLMDMECLKKFVHLYTSLQ